MCYVEVEQDSSINAPVKVCICTIRLKNIDAYSPPRGRLLTLSEPYRSPLSHRICDEDHWLFSPLLAFFFFNLEYSSGGLCLQTTLQHRVLKLAYAHLRLGNNSRCKR